MIARYPHTAKLVLKKELDSPDGIPTVAKEEFDIIGRFEPAVTSNGNIDYRAKYYCQNFKHLLKGLFANGVFEVGLFEGLTEEDLMPFTADGHFLEYEGKKFVLVMLHNYQVHCEIWLA